MMVRKIGLFILLLGIIGCSDRQGKPVDRALTGDEKVAISSDIFPENSIGVVYLDTANDSEYSLVIRFPYFSIPDSVIKRTTATADVPLNIPQQTIILFDEAGKLGVLANVSNCVSRFWCENDGGMQYAPSYVLRIKKDKCTRPLQIKNLKVLGKLSCFAAINYNAAHFKSFDPPTGTEDKNVVMRGRISSDYSGYASNIRDSVYQFYDRNVQIVAEKDEMGAADFCISLQAFNTRQDFELGCCGP